MEIWSWICELLEFGEWSTDESNSPLFFPLVTSSTYKQPSRVSDKGTGDDFQPIQLKAERSFDTDSGAAVTFSILHGENTLWVSDTCPLDSKHPFLPLILQLLQEIISCAPTAQDGCCPRSQLQKLKPDPVLWILESHSSESISNFFDVVLLMRLFWLCVCNAPPEVGSMYFHTLLAPNLELFSCSQAPVLRNFFVSVGVDLEMCFMRTFGYMTAKLLILKELGVGLQMVTPLPFRNLGFSYAVESHGLWIMKSYAAVSAMRLTRRNKQIGRFSGLNPQEAVLKYALAHQQLEAVMQLEYSVKFSDGFIQVGARVDNLRFHIAKLGFNKNEDDDFINEMYFPSKVKVWVGPEMGANYVTSLSLGRSTDNSEQEVETQRVLKGNFGKLKAPELKTTSRTMTRSKMRSWRWDQSADGNVANFESTLCDNATGVEVASWKPSIGGGDYKVGDHFRDRYTGADRAFAKNGDLVFSGSECGERVEWRLNREMEGSVLKWRMGGQVWLSYLPNEVNTSYFETRCVEWCDEVDLPLIISDQ